MNDAGGWLWLIIDVIFVALLGLALVYGTVRWRRRKNPGLEQRRDEATRRLYERGAENERRDTAA